ncbi:MAG: TIGR03936 family radical SAM-associated protein [Actinomycetales bacterium]
MPARTPDGPAPDPTVQRVRLRYAKRGRLRFTSHRDFQRAFERALRRADVPIAFSAGFSPHPKVSYANAAPTGTASEAEYLELGLSRVCDVEALRAALDDALPPGLDVLEAVEATGPALADRLEASVWELRLPGVAGEQARAAVESFLAAPEVEVERLTKNGMRRFDARAAVVDLRVAGEESGRLCAILRLVVQHATPAVRPDDVLTGLRRVANLVPPAPPEVTRLAQGPLDQQSASVTDPLAVPGPLDAVGAVPAPLGPVEDVVGAQPPR